MPNRKSAICEDGHLSLKPKAPAVSQGDLGFGIYDWKQRPNPFNSLCIFSDWCVSSMSAAVSSWNHCIWIIHDHKGISSHCEYLVWDEQSVDSQLAVVFCPLLRRSQHPIPKSKESCICNDIAHRQHVTPAYERPMTSLGLGCSWECDI